MKLQDDQQFGNDMGPKAEWLYGLFERVPKPKWVPCRRKKHYINAVNYPRCVDCEREDSSANRTVAIAAAGEDDEQAGDSRMGKDV